MSEDAYNPYNPYNPYNDIRQMYRTLDRELNRLNQDEILERLESYYDVVPR